MSRLPVLVALCLSFTAAGAEAPGAEVLEAEIARLAAPAGGVTGVAAWRIDGAGPRVAVNADRVFPMASTFKVAVAAALLAEVDAGRLSLDRMITVDPDRHVPSEIIADRFPHPGLSLSVANLLELMLTQSDNTATDVLMELAGGAGRISAWLSEQGIKGQRVDRDTAGLLRDFFELPDGPFPEAVAAAQSREPGLFERAMRPNPTFHDDPRDNSTPSAMAELLTRLFTGKALEPQSTEFLADIMARCRTGEDRIRGRLPPGTPVAHKTGTIGGSLNDVGVITLPDGTRVVIVVFIRESERPFPEREAVIADIARAVHDYFLFLPGASAGRG